MKPGTMLAIVAALVGLAVVVYLATRPRVAASTLTADAAETDGTGSSSAARVTRGVGGGLTEIVAGIAELA